MANKKYKIDKPELKQHSYVKPYAGQNECHASDRERAHSLVHNIVFDKNNPEIRDNPIFMRKTKVDPTVDYDKKSLYLCGQSDKNLSRAAVNDTDSKITSKNFKLIQKAESFMSFELNASLKNFTSRRNSKVVNL